MHTLHCFLFLFSVATQPQQSNRTALRGAFHEKGNMPRKSVREFASHRSGDDCDFTPPSTEEFRAARLQGRKVTTDWLRAYRTATQSRKVANRSAVAVVDQGKKMIQQLQLKVRKLEQDLQAAQRAESAARRLAAIATK